MSARNTHGMALEGNTRNWYSGGSWGRDLNGWRMGWKGQFIFIAPSSVTI